MKHLMRRSGAKLKRMLAAGLVCLLLLTSLPPALADSFPAFVSASSMKVYSDSSLSSVSGTLSGGTVVKVLSYQGGTARISYNGKNGYAKVSDMKRVDAVAKAATVNTKSRVYRSASVSADSAEVAAGTKVNVISVSSGWALVEKGGTGGYMLADTLTYANGTPVSGAKAGTSTATAATVTADKVKVYRLASTSSDLLGTLKKGAKVNVIEINNGWAYVERNGSYGFCSASALSTSAVSPTPTPASSSSTPIPATVTAEKLTFYQKPDTSSTVLGTLKSGASVNVLATKNGWAYAERNGKYGYCKLSGLAKASATATPQPTAAPTAVAVTVMKTTDKVVVYASASASSQKLGTLKKGTSVNMVGKTGEWAYIERNGNYGYCKASALKEADANESFNVETFDATVVRPDAKFYKSASTASASTELGLGTNVTVTAYNGVWAYATVSGTKGYIQLSNLSRAQFAKLTTGSTGSTVTVLETALLTGGYFDGVPNSTYDSATATAVKRFQETCGYAVTGEASEALQRVLYSGNGPTSSLLSGTYEKGSKGSGVTRIQTRLYALGYLSLTTSIDADFGGTTQNAVKLFQTVNGLSASGTADPATLRAMYSTSAIAIPSTSVPADKASVAPKDTVSSGTQTNHSTKISSTLASKTSSFSPSMSNAQKIEYTIYVAQNQLGKPYVYGATGTRSFDCSGLTQYAYRQAGISLKRTAYEQGYDSTYTKISSVSDLRRGDLVFFNTISDGDLSDHAGLYIGAGWFIQASSGQHKVVVSTITSGYYNRVFSWGRRILGG